MIRNILCIALSLVFTKTSAQSPSESPYFTNGSWLGLLKNDKNKTINFNFDVQVLMNKKVINIYNADEKLFVDDIKNVGDSIHVVMPFFDSEFMFKAHADSLHGYWKKNLANSSVRMPFVAYKNKNRFPEVKAISTNKFDGTWATYFINANKDTSFAIAEFKSVKDKVYGTFLSSTGDDRYLEGVSDGKKLWLSSFDGSHAYRYEMELSADGKSIVNGKLYSGKSGYSEFYSEFKPNAKLPDADQLTFLKDGFNTIDFKFKNIEGKEISLDDDQYKNKIVLIQIMGSWCPNCMDESYYLMEYYKNTDRSKIEIIGLCYERSADFTVASRNVQRMKERIGIEYELLIAGTNAKGNVNESLPMLKNFIAFPTMIILDKNHIVRKIHTGYSGPATGKHYVEFKYEFENFIKTLINE